MVIPSLQSGIPLYICTRVHHCAVSARGIDTFKTNVDSCATLRPVSYLLATTVYSAVIVDRSTLAYIITCLCRTYQNICCITKSFLTVFLLPSQLTSMELQGFYGHDTDTSSLSNGEPGSLKHSSPFLLHSGVANKPAGTTTTQTLKFHNHFPPDTHK